MKATFCSQAVFPGLGCSSSATPRAGPGRAHRGGLWAGGKPQAGDMQATQLDEERLSPVKADSFLGGFQLVATNNHVRQFRFVNRPSGVGTGLPAISGGLQELA